MRKTVMFVLFMLVIGSIFSACTGSQGDQLNIDDRILESEVLLPLDDDSDEYYFRDNREGLVYVVRYASDQEEHEIPVDGTVIYTTLEDEDPRMQLVKIDFEVDGAPYSDEQYQLYVPHVGNYGEAVEEAADQPDEETEIVVESESE